MLPVPIPMEASDFPQGYSVRRGSSLRQFIFPLLFRPDTLSNQWGGSSLEKSSGDFSTVIGVPEDPDAPVMSSMSITRLTVAVNNGTSWAAREPESLIRRKNLSESSSLFDFEEVMSIPHNNQGPPPVGSPPLNNNGPPPVKTLEECYDLIENMTAHHNHWDTSATRDETSRTISSTSITESPEVVRQLEMMNKNFLDMMRQIQSVKSVNTKCETCSGLHSFTKCLAVGGYTQKAACATTANPRRDLKAITTRSGVAYDGPTIPPTPSPLSKEVERETEATKDKKTLSLPDLNSTRMTLGLATRSYAYPAGIAEDVFVQVGKLTFLDDFVIIDYDVDPRVPLILGRPFLRTANALVDVHGEELILRGGDENLIFHADNTSKHPHKHGNESTNMINFIDITCEDFFPKVLKFKKSNHPSSGSTTPHSDSSPSLTPFETSDSLLEEFANELTLLDLIPPGKKDTNFDFEVDLREIKLS
nr:reverse transcriptase domain-containing protein [Tanacetum cinerariifolium]